MASMVTSDLEDSINISVFEQSSPESLRSRALAPPTHNHSRSTSNHPVSDYEAGDDYFGHVPVKQCNSSRSSISSFPSSVIHTIPVTDNEESSLRTPSRSQLLSNGRNSPAYKASSNSYLSAFRHPNSVRALQLESEYADSDSHSIARSPRYKKSPKTSYFSPRSPGSIQSSPTKRSSRPGTPQHQRSSSKLKKEFPLVLLHCTLLPPATTTRGSSVSEEILEAVLPENYRKRWRTLQDKVVKNTEVKQRGVLIAHPRDDYDLLEERLLEALELERPRIREGHYIGTSKSDSDSGFESSSQNGTDDGSEVDERDGHNTKEKCRECGKSVSCKIEQDCTWEVKIFAANGLMRSSAWSAAWEQMEKIDVEVAVWMPEDVRFEVEERLKALQAMEEAERPVEEPINPPRKERTRSKIARLKHDERMREIYGEPEKPRTQEEIDGLADSEEPKQPITSVQTPNVQEEIERKIEHILPGPGSTPMQFEPQRQQQHKAPSQPDFPTFMRYHFRMIVNDQRNLAIVLLSALVLLFSVQNLDVNKSSSQQPGAVQSVSTPIDSTIETSVVSVETPLLSYITTTVLATPSSIPTLASLEEDASEPQSMIHIEDYAPIPEPSPNVLPTSSEVAELISEPSSAELETEPNVPAPLQTSPPARPDSNQVVFEVEENADIEDSIAVNLPGKPEPVAPDHQVPADPDSPSQQKSSRTPIADVISSQDVPIPLEERTETLTPLDETEINNLSIASNPPPLPATNNPHSNPQKSIESSTITNQTCTPKSLFKIPKACSLTTSHPSPEDTTLFTPTQLPPTHQVCIATDQMQPEQDQPAIERTTNE